MPEARKGFRQPCVCTVDLPGSHYLTIVPHATPRSAHRTLLIPDDEYGPFTSHLPCPSSSLPRLHPLRPSPSSSPSCPRPRCLPHAPMPASPGSPTAPGPCSGSAPCRPSSPDTYRHRKTNPIRVSLTCSLPHPHEHLPVHTSSFSGPRRHPSPPSPASYLLRVPQHLLPVLHRALDRVLHHVQRPQQLVLLHLERRQALLPPSDPSSTAQSAYHAHTDTAQASAIPSSDPSSTAHQLTAHEQTRPYTIVRHRHWRDMKQLLSSILLAPITALATSSVPHPVMPVTT